MFSVSTPDVVVYFVFLLIGECVLLLRSV